MFFWLRKQTPFMCPLISKPILNVPMYVDIISDMAIATNKYSSTVSTVKYYIYKRQYRRRFAISDRQLIAPFSRQSTTVMRNNAIHDGMTIFIYATQLSC